MAKGWERAAGPLCRATSLCKKKIKQLFVESAGDKILFAIFTQAVKLTAYVQWMCFTEIFKYKMLPFFRNLN